MTYETVEAGLASVLKAITGVQDEEVSIGDRSVLSEGMLQAFVLEYESFETERSSSLQSTVVTWLCRVHLFVRYTEESETYNTMRDRRQNIITAVLQDPTLASTAFDSLPVRGEADEDLVEIGNVSFLHEWLDVELVEVISA